MAEPSTLNLNPQPSTFASRISSLYLLLFLYVSRISSWQNLKPYTLNPQPPTLNPQP
jgi:hypothetical protein